MIGMLVSDQDAVNVTAGQIQTVQTLLHFFATDPYIYQNMSTFRAHINTVSAASAGYTAKSHSFFIPSSICMYVSSKRPLFITT